MRLLTAALFTAASMFALFGLPQSTSAAMVSGSFYHSKFVGRTMACGGQYDHDEFTAASNQHPCNALLQVRKGNRSVVVRVTDRCGNCGIDLSRAAAREIGLYRVGRAPVTVSRVE